MKSTALIIALLIGLAACHVKLPDVHDYFTEDVESKKDDIIDFFEGLFSYFNLSSPGEIKDCFNNVNSGLYFTLLQEINRILEVTKERSSFQLHLELGKLAILHQTLKTTHACIIMTEDFTDLLNALDVKKRDVEEFKMFLYLYYQAHYLDLFEGFKPVIDNLSSQNSLAAGDAFGSVLSDLVYTIKKEGSAHLAFAAFGNGAAITLDIDEPDDSLDCFDKNASRLSLEFTYRLADFVSEGSIKETLLNVYKFWEDEGKDIMSQIPQSVFECQAKSEDVQKINQKLGVDVTTTEFFQRMLKYISDNRFGYYAICRSMKGALEHHNFHHAGSIHGHLLKAIAATKL